MARLNLETIKKLEKERESVHAKVTVRTPLREISSTGEIEQRFRLN